MQTVDLPPDEVEQELIDRRWTDGLPVRLPTPDRIQRFLEATRLDPTEVVGPVPPAHGIATVENIAVNAYMAGCAPEHVQFVVAALRALLDERYNLNMVQCTTNPVAPMVVVNGPLAAKVGCTGGTGALGPGAHANPVIGRAVRLVLGNLGGTFDGTDLATHGSPLKFSCCLAEAADASPWEPLHVTQGFDADETVVTVFAVESLINTVPSFGHATPDQLVDFIGRIMRTFGTNYYWSRGSAVIVLNPRHARIFAEAGLTKRMVQELLYDAARIPLEQLPFGNVPVGDWTAVDGRVLCVEGPEDIHIVVGGGAEGHHTLYGAPFGLSSLASARV